MSARITPFYAGFRFGSGCQMWDNWSTTERSPSRVIGVPQLGLLATNQHYLKGA